MISIIIILSIIVIIFGLLGTTWHDQIDKITPDHPKYKTATFFTSLTNKSVYNVIVGVGVVALILVYVVPNENDVPVQEQSSSSYNEATSTNTNTSYSDYSNNSKSCDWCGDRISGTHYTHLGKMSPCQSTNSSSSLGTYCSMKCCSEARKSSCPSCY